MLANCRRYLANLRAAAAAGRTDPRRCARPSAGPRPRLPGGFGQRVAQAAEILQKYPSDPVKAALRENVANWLEESLPAKQLDERPELQEAQTKDGRILRGFFRAVSGPGGTAGFKRYDTWEEFQNPTADVGTWRSEDFASPPAATLPQRAVRQYNDQRTRLLARARRAPGVARVRRRLPATGDAVEPIPRQARPRPADRRLPPGSGSLPSSRRQHVSGKGYETTGANDRQGTSKNDPGATLLIVLRFRTARRSTHASCPPYSQEISRQHKACFLFLLDQSFSMEEPLGGSSNRKCDELATAINGWLQNMAIRASGDEGIKDWMDVGVFGYRTDSASNMIIEPALLGELAGKRLVSITEIGAKPARIDTRSLSVPRAEVGFTKMYGCT